MNDNHKIHLKQNFVSIFLMTSLILFAGVGIHFLLTGTITVSAQKNNSTDISSIIPTNKIILDKPFFIEKGIITKVRGLGNNNTEFTYTGNGTINDSIKVTTKGVVNTTLREGHIEIGKIEGQITTTNENANYSIAYVQNLDERNPPTFIGSTIWETNSKGVLAPFDNAFGILKGESDSTGNIYTYKVWELK
jgi:hypothetical protein